MYWYDPTEYYETVAKKMYPSSYHKLKPYIKMVCDREDHPYNPGMFPFPNEAKLNEMTDEIIEYYQKDYEVEFKEDELSRGRHHHDSLFGDIIKILIIKELIDRRCKRRPYCW